MVYGSSVSPLQRLKCSKVATTLARCAGRMASAGSMLEEETNAAKSRMWSME